MTIFRKLAVLGEAFTKPAPEMEYKRSSRGFKHLPEIVGRNGETVRVYESSSVEPSVWVKVESGPAYRTPSRTRSTYDGAIAHLDLDTVEKLRDQLSWILEHHWGAER